MRWGTRGALVALGAAVWVVAAPGPSAAAARSAPVAALAAEAQAIEDANAVKKLQRAFGYYLDRGYWGEAADLFAADATFEWGQDGVYVGKKRIHEYLARQGGGNSGPGLPFGQYNHHMQLQPVVHVAPDGRTAKGRWRGFSLTGQIQVSADWGLGVYENSYVKQGGVWKIQALHFYPAFVAPYEGGWATLKPGPADWRSKVAQAFPSDRPPSVRYSLFPAQFTPAFHYDQPAPAGAAPAATGAEAQRLAILRSRQDIENLQAAFGYYADAGLWSKAAGLFTPGGTYEDGQKGVYVGPDRIARAMALTGPEGLAPGQLNIYMMLQPIIDIAPDNRTAKARWRSDVMLSRDGKAQWGEGEYENSYVNVGGAWKISAHHFYRTVFSDYDKGWGVNQIPMEGASRAFPPDRPPTEVYASFPAAHLTPFHYANPVTGARPAAQSAPAANAALDPLRRRIARLEDHDAIEKLQRAYGYYVDKNLWNDVAALFSDDSTVEIGGRGIFAGKPHVLAYMQSLGPTGPTPEFLMNHQQFQGIVDVSANGREAAGRWTAFVMAGKMPRADWGDVVYENIYAKEGGVWRIKTLHAAFQMYTPYPDGWAKTGTVLTRPDSWPPPPDYAPSVVYNNYPNFFVEPFHYPNPVTGAPMPKPHPSAGGASPMPFR